MSERSSHESKIARAVSAAMSRANGSRSWSAFRPCTRVILISFLLLSVWFTASDAAKSSRNDEPAPRGGGNRPIPAKEVEPVIEEVTAKQLERALNEKDFVAVYWCKCQNASESRVLCFVRIIEVQESKEIDFFKSTWFLSRRIPAIRFQYLSITPMTNRYKGCRSFCQHVPITD